MNWSSWPRYRQTRAIEPDFYLQQLAEDPESAIALESPPGINHLAKSIRKHKKFLIKILKEKHTRALSERLFWYQEFGSKLSVNVFSFLDGDSFQQNLTKLQRVLENSSQNSDARLHLCILSTSPIPKQILRWPSQFLAISVGLLDALLAFPSYVLVSNIEEWWGELSTCTYKSIEKPDHLPKVEQLSLPELRSQFLCHTATSCTCKRFTVAEIFGNHDARPWSHYNAAPKYEGRTIFKSSDSPAFAIELPSQGRGRNSKISKAQFEQCSRIFQRKSASFSFTWQRAAPTYKGAFDTFLWERHSKPPLCDYVEVFYQNDTPAGQNGPRRVLMICNTTPDLVEAKPLLEDLKGKLNQKTVENVLLWPFLETLHSNPDTDGYYLLPLFVVFEQISEDTSVFLHQAFDEIMNISYAGRSGSSVEKIQYLCHLDDCRQSALLGLTQLASVVDILTSVITQERSESGDASIEIEFLTAVTMDIKFLMKELNEVLRKRITDESSVASNPEICGIAASLIFFQIKGHGELAQTRQTSTLTYMAAIWVPFSFVTSMLSMQVTDPAAFFHRGNRDPLPDTNSTGADTESAQDTVNYVPRQLRNSTTAVPSPTSELVALLQTQWTELTAINRSVSGFNAPAATAHVWPFELFIVLATVFFFTSLLLPLIGPNLLRVLVQRSYKFRNLWIFWPFIFVLYYISVYWVIPNAIRVSRGCSDDPQIPGGNCFDDNGYLYVEYFNTAGYNPINFVTYVVSAVVMGSIGLVNITLAIMYRRNAVVIMTWLLFDAIVVVFYWIDWYKSIEQYWSFDIGSGLSLSAIIPIFYLILVWLLPQLWSWWRRLQAKKDKRQ